MIHANVNVYATYYLLFFIKYVKEEFKIAKLLGSLGVQPLVVNCILGVEPLRTFDRRVLNIGQ